MKKIIAILMTAIILLPLVPSALADGETENVIYISADAKGGNGSIESPYSLSEGISAVDRLKGKGPVTAYLRGGEYALTKTLEFKSTNSGTQEAPITYKAYENEKVILKGSVDIPASNISRVSDEAVRSRLQDNVKDKVYAVSLPQSIANSIGKLYEYNVGAYVHSYDFNMPDVFYDGELMQISQWPNIGFADVEKMTYGEQEITTGFAQETAKRFSNWKSMDEAIYSYYTKAGYEHFFARPTAVSAAENAIKVRTEDIDKNYTRMGPNANARVNILNLLEEIDVPGEWCIDTKNNVIYLYPYAGKISGKVSVSVVKDPLIVFNEAKYINLEGITIGYCRSDAIRIQNKSAFIGIKDCDILNAGTNGVNLNNAVNCTVEGNNIYNVGSNGVFIEQCGNRITLVEGNTVVRNNDIFNTSRNKKCASGGIVTYESCGVDLSYNRIHRIPHQGVWIANTAIAKIDHNEVYEAVRETMDAGALYVNGNSTDWGVEFTNNYIHDITNELSGRGSTHGTYADAQHHNVKMDNNIFYNVKSGAAFQNGGSYGSIVNNIFIDCPYPMIITNYAARLNWATSNRTDALSKVNKEAYFNRFPEMSTWATYDGDDRSRRICVGFSVYNNVSLGSNMSNIGFDSLDEYKKRIDNNIGTKDDYSLLGYDKNSDDFGLDFSYGKDAPVFKQISDFNVIDFENIGIDEVKELKKVSLLAPENGSANIEGNDVTLAWTGTPGAYRYRVIVAIDSNFEAVVFDEIVNDNKCTVDTLKYGLRTYYWKVIPVCASKSEKVVDDEPMVFSFTTKKSEAVDKKELRALVTGIGNNISTFSYPQELVEAVNAEKDSAKALLDSSKAKQSNIKTQTKKLSAALGKLYDATITKTYELDEFLKNPDKWVGSVDALKTETYVGIPAGESRVLSYEGQQIEPGETVKFTLKFNPSNYQSIGICENPTVRLWETPGYSAVMRLGYIELQRYNYDGEGNLSGGIIKYFPAKGVLVAEQWMMVEFGYSQVHNGTRVILRVNGTTLIDYVDTTNLAVTGGGYFRLENGTPTENIYAGSVNNDISQAGVGAEVQ